jgi:hypothetical protein
MIAYQIMLGTLLFICFLVAFVLWSIAALLLLRLHQWVVARRAACAAAANAKKIESKVEVEHSYGLPFGGGMA